MKYFSGRGKKRKSFIIVTILSVIGLLLGVFTFGYQFIYFKEVEKSDGLYMNLSEKSTGGVCSADPFSSHLPLSFTYNTKMGDYSYTCRPEIFLQMIGHVIVSFSFTFFCGATYVFGMILVQKKVFYFIPLFALFSLSLGIVGVYEIIITQNNVTFCENDLIREVFNGTKTEFTPEPVVYPDDIECSMNSNIAFASFRVVLAFYGLVLTVIITIIYLMYRREKIRERNNEEYKNMDKEIKTPLDQQLPSIPNDSTPGPKATRHPSVPVYEEEPSKSKSSSSSSSSKHSYSDGSSSD